jgi:hypothetical protein
VPIGAAAVIVVAVVAAAVALRGGSADPGGGAPAATDPTALPTDPSPMDPNATADGVPTEAAGVSVAVADSLAADSAARLAAADTSRATPAETSPQAQAPRTTEQRAEDPSRPTPSPPPANGTLRIAGSLPAGAEVTVTGADGRTRPLSGGNVMLPPGTYTLEARAPGHRPVSRRLTLRSGATESWTPQLEAIPAEQAATPPPATPAEAPPAEAQVREILSAFVAALASRDLDAVARTYPGAGGAWGTQWRPFFENTRDVRNLSVRLLRIDGMSVDGDIARATIAVQMSYDDFRNRRQEPRFDFEATLRATGGSWSLAELRQIQ